jgi:hypothetical protein
VLRAIHKSHDERREEAAEPAGGADDAGDSADLVAGATLPTKAKTAPAEAPSNAARPRKSIVAIGISAGWNAWMTAKTAVPEKQAPVRGPGAIGPTTSHRWAGL